MQALDHACTLAANRVHHGCELIARTNRGQSRSLRKHVHRIDLANRGESIDYVGRGNHIPNARACHAERLGKRMQYHEVVAFRKQLLARGSVIGELAIGLVDHHKTRTRGAHLTHEFN